MNTPPLPEFDGIDLKADNFGFGLHWVFGGLFFMAMAVMSTVIVLSFGL